MTTPPNFKPGVGRLATDRYDFQSHLDGKDGFRHNSSQIDIDPLDPLGSATTLDLALQNIGTFINSENSKGDGFITVGDGYDSWANANALTGVYFDNTTPYLDDLLNPIFQAILDNGIGTSLEVNPLPAQFKRIERGGTVLIRSGTYIVKSPILVPPGICIMGEGFGTKIVNASSLVLNPLPPAPKVSPTPAPVFKIVADGYRAINDAAISGNNIGGPTDYKLFMFGRKSQISNLVISDNFVEIPSTGDVFYKIPQNKTGENPLIQQEQGSNCILDNVYIMGRVNFSSGQVVSTATRFAIQLDGYSPNQNGTYLQIKDCFIDGFSIPIDFQSTGGSNDFLTIQNSKIRAFGYLDGNASVTSNPESNTIIRSNDNNIILTGNHFYGNSDSVGSVVFVNAVLGASVNAQAKSKMVISGNTVTIDRSKNTANSTFKVLKVKSSISNFGTKVSSTVFGNPFQGSVGFEVQKDGASASAFSITSSNVIIALPLVTTSAVYRPFTTVTGVYTVLDTDDVIGADTNGGALTITLPSAPAYTGRYLTIKDSGGVAGTSNITVNAAGGQTIDGASFKIISTNYGVLRLISNGTSWSVI